MKNQHTIDGDHVNIVLNRKHGDTLTAYVSTVDLPKVQSIDGTFYPMTNEQYGFLARLDIKLEGGRNKLVQLHRVVAEPPPGMKAVFIDGNGLNCRRENIVHVANNVTREQVLVELARITPPPRSKVRGVTLHRATGLWYASGYWPKKENCEPDQEPKRYSAYYEDMATAEAAMQKFREIGPAAFSKPDRRGRHPRKKNDDKGAK